MTIRPLHQQYIVKGGSSLPNPATYCPTNGYYDPNLPIPYIPDPEIPEIIPNSGEIVLFFSNQLDNAVCCTTTRTGASGNIRYTIYGENNDQLHTKDVANNTAFFYVFPLTGGIPLNNGTYGFKVVIKVATVGTLNTFTMSTRSGYTAGFPLLEAHFNAPTLTSLSSAFSGQKTLQYIKFHSNHNSLTTLATFCYANVALREVDMQVQMNALTTMAQICDGCTLLESVKFQTSVSALTTLYYAFNLSGLKQAVLLPTLPEVTTIERIYGNCNRMVGTVTFPSMPKCVNTTFALINCSNIQKVKFTGNCNFVTTGSPLRGCIMLEELDMDTTSTWGVVGGTAWSMGNFCYGNTNLKKIKFPASIVNLTTASGNSFLFDNPFSIEEMTVCDWTGCLITAAIQLNCNPYSFNQPTLKVTGLSTFVASSSRQGRIAYIEIDWINSTGNINLSYQNLSTSEINRIFTALPSGVTARTINVTNNPGYATCDKTIATAKGWTVT